MPDFKNRDADEESVRLSLDEEIRGHDHDRGITDDGHTSGGGSLGHDQPEKVRRETPTRNANDREDMPDRNATGSGGDPVMPKDDATLNTKI